MTLKLNRAERRKFIIELRGRGYQLQEIAGIIGSSKSQVSYDLKLIRTDADEQGIDERVRIAADDIHVRKMKAEYERIRKAQAEMESEMQTLVEAADEWGLINPTAASLDEWFKDDDIDATEEEEPEWVKAAEAALEAHLDDDPQEDE
tara:strand:- start:249 stop:692 length:444 start_codon:yes stop_codon:yes gene_type:complete